MTFRLGNILTCVRSAADITRYILSPKKPDVLFYYPQHFNRTAKGENPYFLPLIDICQQNGLKVRLIEESINSSKKCNRNSLCFDLILSIQIVIRKIYIKIASQYNQDLIDGYIAKVFNFLTFGKFRVKCIVTISNANIRFWATLNNIGTVCDLQHGIIYSGHPGYFTVDGQLPKILQRNNVRILLWGDIYKKRFENISDNVNLDRKLAVVGYPMYKPIEITTTPKARIIIVSLQFTADIDCEKTFYLMGMLEDFVEVAVSRGFNIMLKHHPRFAEEVDLNPLLQNYKGRINLTKDSLDELARKTMLHVTWGSTTTFEYAAYGVPTLLLYDSEFDWATDQFYCQFQYPLYRGMTPQQVFDRISDVETYSDDCYRVKQWYESAYSPMNEDLLLKIFTGETDLI